jgi:hypothetical protein
VELSNAVKIAGLHWQENETFNIIGVNKLGSRVLCERHNNALSPLDAVVGGFALAIREFDHAFRVGAQSAPVDEKVFSGDDVQRWMLKCLIGLTASGNLNAAVKPECVEVLYGRLPWPVGWGLYWLNRNPTTVYHSDSFAIEAAMDPQTQTILLGRFFIRGMHLGLCMGKPDHPQVFGVFRPAALIFRAPGRERRLILQWEGVGASHQAVFLERVGTYDGPPPDWREWEQF